MIEKEKIAFHVFCIVFGIRLLIPLSITPLFGDTKNNNVSIEMKETMWSLLSQPQSQKSGNVTEKSSLIQQIKTGEIREAVHMVSRGVDPNELDNNGTSALLYAIYDGNEELVSLLIEAGADVDFQDSIGWTPLLLAVYTDRPRLVKLLIKTGTDVNKSDITGSSPLLYAVMIENIEIINLLLKYGADIKSEDKKGKYIMDHAVEQAVDDDEILMILNRAILNKN